MRRHLSFDDGRPPAPVLNYRHPRDAIVDPIEEKFDNVRKLALVAAALHNLAWFLGVCSLTWASMVVLGGLVTYLRRSDFIISAVLLLLEAIRFVSAVSITHLFTNHTLHIHSKAFIIFLRMAVPALQLLVNCVPSIALPLAALNALRRLQPYYRYENQTDLQFHVITTSLSVFYFLTLLNASVSAAFLLYSIFLSLGLLRCSGIQDESMQKYYDEILWRGVRDGFLKATGKIPLFIFAYEIQATAYAAGMDHRLVFLKFKQLIRYLYYNSKGMECACVYLDSSDTYLQQAAAIVVGQWTSIYDENDRQDSKSTRFRDRLLSKLADKIGMGWTGWAAANSFRLLGEMDPELVLNTKSEVGKKKVVSILMENIGRADKWSGSCMRAILPLLRLLPRYVDQEDISKLEANLRTIMSNRAMWASERFTAATAVVILRGAQALTEEERGFLNVIAADHRDFFSSEERNYFEVNLGDVLHGFREIPVSDQYGPNFTSGQLSRAKFAIVSGVLVWLALAVCGYFLVWRLWKVAS